MFAPANPRTLIGVEAVIDKDLASQLLAGQVGADLLVMATDVDGVYADWSRAEQRRLGQVTSAELRPMPFAAGSMGPKAEAAALFVEGTRKLATRHRRLGRDLGVRGRSRRHQVVPG